MDARRTVTVADGGTVVADFTLEPSRPVAVVEDATAGLDRAAARGPGLRRRGVRGHRARGPHRAGRRLPAGDLQQRRRLGAADCLRPARRRRGGERGVGRVRRPVRRRRDPTNLITYRGDPAVVRGRLRRGHHDRVHPWTPSTRSSRGSTSASRSRSWATRPRTSSGSRTASYSGTTLAELTSDDPEDGPVIGNGVGYRFSSATSVEIILASLSAGTYGRPDEPVGAAGRWTPEAVQVYLNAVDWATSAEQGVGRGHGHRRRRSRRGRNGHGGRARRHHDDCRRRVVRARPA